jgi:hypothetical protein
MRRLGVGNSVLQSIRLQLVLLVMLLNMPPWLALSVTLRSRYLASGPGGVSLLLAEFKAASCPVIFNKISLLLSNKTTVNNSPAMLTVCNRTTLGGSTCGVSRASDVDSHEYAHSHKACSGYSEIPWSQMTVAERHQWLRAGSPDSEPSSDASATSTNGLRSYATGSTAEQS